MPRTLRALSTRARRKYLWRYYGVCQPDAPRYFTKNETRLGVRGFHHGTVTPIREYGHYTLHRSDDDLGGYSRLDQTFASSILLFALQKLQKSSISAHLIPCSGRGQS